MPNIVAKRTQSQEAKLLVGYKLVLHDNQTHEPIMAFEPAVSEQGKAVVKMYRFEQGVRIHVVDLSMPKVGAILRSLPVVAAAAKRLAR
jgi:hypothetical protein